MNELISRQDALAKGERYYFTGVPCKNGHVCLREAKRTTCLECQKMWDRERNALPHRREASSKWQKQNRGRMNEIARAFHRRNPEKREAFTALRRAAKLQATPPWLTAEHKAQMREMYRTRPQGHEVDHIVPLQGENVCGLHVPWNLQHLPMLENRKKGRSFSEQPSSNM